MPKDKMLVIGANGQLGSILTRALRQKYGQDNVIASDIHLPIDGSSYLPFEILDASDGAKLVYVIERYRITHIYHLAAMLSAKGEINPLDTWNENMNSLFNVFRFGTVVNRLYLEREFRTTPNSRVLKYAMAVWFSPRSGILLFWPILTVVLVWTVVMRLRNVHAATGAERFQDLLIVLFIGGLSMNLALWFTPFGWIAFGPRLAVPFLPALVLLLVDRWRGSEELVKNKHGRVALLVVSEPLVVLGLFQAVSPWSWWSAVVRLMAPTGTCPLMTQLVLSDNPPRYYSCAERFMWRISDPVLGRVVELHSAGSWIAFCASVVALASACGWALMSNASSGRAIEAAVQLESNG